MKKINVKKQEKKQTIESICEIYHEDLHERKSHIPELEARFGTKKRNIDKSDFNNVMDKLQSMGFICENPLGNYHMKITPDFVNKEGEKKSSNVRVELNGIQVIQQYCKNENLKKLAHDSPYESQIGFNQKLFAKRNDHMIKPVDNDDFNFRVSFQHENILNKDHHFVQNLIKNWDNSKKMFRHINRYTLTHPTIPIKCDLSIVKQSIKSNSFPYLPLKTFNISDSKIFSTNESFEIELEVLNDTVLDRKLSLKTIIQELKMVIKYVLCGLQKTYFPVSYRELFTVSKEYEMLINEIKKEDEEEYLKKINLKNIFYKLNSSQFIGPSSYTLQLDNIREIDETSEKEEDFPNVRKEYTVTDKADGERNLMFITKQGKIYLLDTNMNFINTGMITKTKGCFSSLLDGELIKTNKSGELINLFAAFDIYYANKQNSKKYSFINNPSFELKITDENDKKNTEKKKKDKNISRLELLQTIVDFLNPECVVKSNHMLDISVKHFELIIDKDSVFNGCTNILSNISSPYYKYNTDGLIFTPAYLPVPVKTKKITWTHSFKWKPPEFNTIDFLIKVNKDKNNADIIQSGLQMSSKIQYDKSINRYKSLTLLCGFDSNKHIYINPLNSIINGDFKSLSNDEHSYKPLPFFPCDPYDDSAHKCNITLMLDDKNIEQMYTIENEIIEDNTIVEFAYEKNNEIGWRWVPLRVRHDKTYRYRTGVPEYGNAYHVANSNWHSIHHPVTEQMIQGEEDIPELQYDDVYYKGKKEIRTLSRTKPLRDFHNLVIKKMLINNIAKPGDTLIDLAVGKGGDLPKWIYSKFSFVYGIDYSKDNIENKLDGACTRYLKSHVKNKHTPKAIFLHGDSSKTIYNGDAFKSDKYKTINDALFGRGSQDEKNIGKIPFQNYGVGKEGFNICSCQFALHYFWEKPSTLKNFIENVTISTKMDGYFIGTCYDGEKIFDMFNEKEENDEISVYDETTKLWSIKKLYKNKVFEPNVESIGCTIDVYQESINQEIPEYLVHFKYFVDLMEQYGFVPLSDEESNEIGFPSAINNFEKIFNQITNNIDKKIIMKKDIGETLNITDNEKTISFLNKYFIFKKIRSVNISNIKILNVKQDIKEKESDDAEDDESKTTKNTEIKDGKLNIYVKKLNKKIRITKVKK